MLLIKYFVLTSGENLYTWIFISSLEIHFYFNCDVKGLAIQMNIGIECVRGCRSLVEVESTYWGVVKLFNTQNELMDVHQSDISKILLCSTSNLVSFIFIKSRHFTGAYLVLLHKTSHTSCVLFFFWLPYAGSREREHTFCFFEVRLFVAFLLQRERCVYRYNINIYMKTHVYTHNHILLSSLSSSSSCLSPLFPIVHRFWQIFQATSRILTQLLYVCSSWSSSFSSAICGAPYVYISYELVPAPPAVSCMPGSSNLDSFHDGRQVAI